LIQKLEKRLGRILKMLKYYNISDKWKHGFITHDDRRKLKLDFVVTGQICKVTGEEKDIEKWAERTEVHKITEEVALAEIKQLTFNGLMNKKAQLESELIDIESKIIVVS